MSASFTVDFAKIRCWFDNFGFSPFYDSWQWKLDPFRFMDSEKSHCKIYFRNVQAKEEFSDVKEKVYEVQDGFFLRQVFVLQDGGTQWRYVRKSSGEILLSYYINRKWSEIILSEDHTGSAGHMAFEYLCHLFPPCGLQQDILTFHGVLMEYDGYGVIISAPSGTGKTTHARLWRDYKRALIINGDRATCRKVNDVWTGFGLPWSGTSGEQINRSVPIKAIVVLERGEENKAFSVKGQDAFAALLPHILCPTWDGELTGKALDLLDDFMKSIPVIRLQCRPDLESVDVLMKVLKEV